jgi:hypothetical protein
VELPPEALLSEPRVSFDGGVLAGTDRLPHMVAGVAAEPGMPDQVRVWTSENTRRWASTDVPLDGGAHASVVASTTDGRITALVGTTWTADRGLRPLVLSSDDRRTWRELVLPQAARERAVDPQGVAVNDDGDLVLVGLDRDQLPVAIVAGEDGAVVDLPAPGENLEQRALAGIAVDGGVVVVLAHVGEPGETGHPVTYRSTDGGATWKLGDGPTDEAGAGVTGIVRASDGFVATGSVPDDTGYYDPAAWSSPDGRRWTAEDVPDSGDSEGPVSAPAVRGNQVVAAFSDDRETQGVVVRRDAAGRWSIHGRTRRWVAPSLGSAVAPLADGAVLTAMWVRNTGIVGVIADGEWATSADTLGPNESGLAWNQLAINGETPVLIGSTTDFRILEGSGWVAQDNARRFAFTDDATIAPARRDPPASEELLSNAIVSDDSGATVVLGTRVTEEAQGTVGERVHVNGTDLAGWFRMSPDADWKPVEGLAGPRTEHLTDAFWLGDEWLIVGGDHEDDHVNTHQYAAVWTSSDGRAWSREDGPFEISDERDSWVNGACGLPGDRGVLVVGAAYASKDRSAGAIPMAWRGTGDGWTRIDRSALGGGQGGLSSCAVRDDVTVVQGRYRNRDTLWRTADGTTFEATALGGRAESFATVRSIASGFAAAGTRSVGHGLEAVVWLSRDGEEWQPVAVPSSRPLVSSDVLAWDGRLVVAATAPFAEAGHPAGDPEVWVLENAGELLAASGTDS